MRDPELRHRIVIDLDGTLAGPVPEGGTYADCPVIEEVAARLREYHAQGFAIVIATSRNMRTHQGNLGKINARTLPVILDWLQRHEIPFDEIHVGKPWCGFEGFYVDDRALRPDEFVRMSYEEVQALIGGRE